MAEDSLLTAEQKFALIEAVRGHPMLYDKVNVDYHNPDRKNKVWAEIVKKAGVDLPSGKDAKEGWDRLRTIFKRNRNRKTTSGQAWSLDRRQESRTRAINEYLRREKVRIPRSPVKKREVPGAEDPSDHSESEPEPEQPQDFEVERVLDERWVHGQRQYLLEWVEDDLPSWEPASNVDNCDGLLVEFNEDLDPGLGDDDFSD